VIVLDDGTARIEVSCNHERFQRFKDIIQVERVVVIEGDYEREGFDRPMGRLTKAFSLNEIDKNVPIVFKSINPRFMQNLWQKIYKIYSCLIAMSICISISQYNYRLINLMLRLSFTWSTMESCSFR
jgi:hypothetical protein